MKTLYVDCSMGVSGEMLAGALLDLDPDKAAFIEELNTLQIPGVHLSVACNKAGGIIGTRFTTKTCGAQGKDICEHMQQRNVLCELENFLSGSLLPENVIRDVLSVFNLMIEAEQAAYGDNPAEHGFCEADISKVVADVITVCLLMHKLNPEKVFISPIPVGYGTIRDAHGVLPLPTPATAHILRNMPICGGQSAGERCTIIGAALLKHFATDFCDLPTMKISQIGYGIDECDCVSSRFMRVMLGNVENSGDEILELSCNVDDMTGEEVGFALEQFLTAGALDAYTEAISMKKSRPAVKICVICRQEKKEAMVSLMFRHTTTLGVREAEYKRCTLHREIQQVQTPYGIVRRKDSHGYGVSRSKYEYEDLARIAKEKNLSIDEVLAVIRQS